MNIGIYIYDDAEVLDFSGPFEVLSTSKRLADLPWNISLIAENKQPVIARGNFIIQPHFSIDDHPDLDVLIVVGGIHTREIKKQNVIEWITAQAKTTHILASVCTGAFLLAEAKLLDGLTVTTHWEDQADLAKDYPALNVVADKEWIQQGNIITSGGISAGIAMSLHLVSLLISVPLAEKTARQMAYHWQPSV